MTLKKHTPIIGILYISTGDYNVFWQDFYETMESHFLLHTSKKYFIFTDKPSFFPESDNIIVNSVPNRQWPYPTLLRFHYFMQNPYLYDACTHLFFCNGNMLIEKDIGNEILPKHNEIITLNHPGFYACKKHTFPYENRKKSMAYIPIWKGKNYVAGGFFGAKKHVFIDLCKTLQKNIDTDMHNNIMAIWHDESHLNAYIHDKDYHALPPIYGCPEKMTPKLPDSKIIFRDKARCLNNNDTIKKRYSIVGKILKRARNYYIQQTNIIRIYLHEKGILSDH